MEPEGELTGLAARECNLHTKPDVHFKETAMTRGIAFVGLLAIGLAAQNILHYARYKRARREQNRALQTWETEGGAVPTGPSQTAAQVTPVPARAELAG
jgi:hypothetical protein